MCGNVKSKAAFLCVEQISVTTHFLCKILKREVTDVFGFYDISKTLKKISTVMFTLCMIVGILAVFIGLVMFCVGAEGEYMNFSEAINVPTNAMVGIHGDMLTLINGKILIKSGFSVLISSIAFLATYALGEMVGYLKEIKDKLQGNTEKEEE